MSKAAITISVDPTDTFHDHGHQGWRHFLYLDPEAREVSTWSVVGGGMPAPVFHARAVMMSLPDCHGEDLHTWCVNNLDRIEGLFARYLGSDWNGSNWIGQWEVVDEYDDPTEYEWEFSDLPGIWSADEWMGGDGGPGTEELNDYLADPEAALDAIVHNAFVDGNARLDRDELREYMDEKVEERREAEEDDR